VQVFSGLWLIWQEHGNDELSHEMIDMKIDILVSYMALTLANVGYFHFDVDRDCELNSLVITHIP
jgi:hypothetical protein